jgi:hypothetical protein
MNCIAGNPDLTRNLHQIIDGVCTEVVGHAWKHLCPQQLDRRAAGQRLVLWRHLRGNAGGRRPSGCSSGSAKLLNGTTHRFSTPSHRRQCDDLVLRMFVTPGSDFLPCNANTGDGMPHLAMTSSRPSVELRTIGAE